MIYKSTQLSEYEKNYRKNILTNYVMKGLSIIFCLINTRLTLNYLGVSLYGMWVTITAIMTCMSAGDLGIGNGLRNELAAAYANSDENKQYNLIKTAIKSLEKISIILFFIFILLGEILIHFEILQKDLRIPFFITSFFFCINLVLGLSQSVAYGYQMSWMSTFATCAVQVFSVICIVLLELIEVKPDLIRFAILYGICCTLPNIILLIIIIKNKPCILSGCFDIKLKTNICNIGIQFFVLQICYVILTSTDNIIINYFFEPSQVSEYSILSNIYNTGLSIFSTILIAFWSAVTFHIATKDYLWIEKKIRRLIILWILFSVWVIVVSLCINFIVKIWLGNQAIVYENKLVFMFAIYTIVYSFSSIFVHVINGIGNVQIELILSIIGAALNIPLSIYFSHTLRMGIFGIKLATFVCILFTAIIIPIQVITYLKSLKN